MRCASTSKSTTRSRLMVDRMPWDITAAGADGEKAAPAARPRPGRHLIAVMLLTAAVLDLARCGLVLGYSPAPGADRGAGRGRAGRGRTERADRTRMPGPALAGLAALLIGAASPRSGHVRLPRPVHDPRYGHRCPGSSAGRGGPGHRRWRRATGPVHRKPVHHRHGSHLVTRSARGSPRPVHGTRRVLGRAVRRPVPEVTWFSALAYSGLLTGWDRRPELVTGGEQERCDRAQLVKTGAGKLGGWASSHPAGRGTGGGSPWRRAPCTAAANRKSEQNAVTIRVSRRERHRNRRPAPTSSRAPASARPGSDGAGRPGAQRRCAGHLRTTHPVDAAGDRRCRRNRRGGPSVPAEEMIAPRPHTGGLSALNPKPWAGPRAGSPRTSGPGRRHYRPGIGSDPARGQA